MNKFATLVLLLAACARADDTTSDLKSEVTRQKRLLFFDEGGSLVQTYSNPYMNRLSENGQNLPYYGNFLNPFFNFIRHFGNSLVAYTIPVSNAIIQSIKLNPNLKNTLVVIPKKDPVVAPNALCEGKRSQIPAPNLCNNFLNCWDGWAFEQECPTGLLFSSNGYCDYADNVDCRNRKLNVVIPQPQPACSKDFEAFRNEQNCNEFFVCVSRQPIRFKCPADLAYNQYLGVCDYADRVDCSSAGSSSAVNPTLHPSYPTPAPSPVRPIPPALSDTPVIPQDISMIPVSTEIPKLPEISTTPAIPISPELPTSPTVPISPTIPTLPTIPALPTSPQSPVIPPAPAVIPPNPSLLPPGSVFPPSFPASISHIHPSQRPVPPEELYQASPVPQGILKPGDKPALHHNGFHTPGCSCATIAKSRQDAIHQLQQASSTIIS